VECVQPPVGPLSNCTAEKSAEILPINWPRSNQCIMCLREYVVKLNCTFVLAYWCIGKLLTYCIWRLCDIKATRLHNSCYIYIYTYMNKFEHTEKLVHKIIACIYSFLNTRICQWIRQGITKFNCAQLLRRNSLAATLQGTLNISTNLYTIGH